MLPVQNINNPIPLNKSLSFANTTSCKTHTHPNKTKVTAIKKKVKSRIFRISIVRLFFLLREKFFNVGK